MQAAVHVRWFCLAFVTYRLSSQTYSPQSECISKTSDSRLFFLIPSRHINKTFTTLINLLITLWNLKSSFNLMNLFIRYIYQKPLTFSFGVDLLNQNRPSPGQAQEYPRKTFFLYYFCYGELPKGHQSLVNSWWIAAVPEELQESKPQAEMANRTNKPNRTFWRSCSVCSSSAPLRTEPNNALVRFVFGRLSNIDTLVRFCSDRTRTEQYLCSVRVLQVRTRPCKVENRV